ncbi:phage tail protein [Paenibacillus durus]|uniref:Prophage tail endopeptidase domain-containing protein n=1 Tax=Paenibacillus durus TaxID=44251 RepID=A0A089HS95_PAEDU|nr:phage tail protein [Paenibacillus durus]AIQ13625.1 hypothetical protein PDUR_18125 [Paenibacillus durus]
MTQYLQSYDKNRQRIGVLVDAYDITRTRRINADYSLTFSVPMTSADYREKLPLKGHVMDERGQYYVINSRQRTRDGRKLTAQISCSHVMFKLADYKFPYASYIDEAYGIHITQLTALIQSVTGGRFVFSVDDTFDLVDVKDFGRGNCLEALNYVINAFGAEVDPDNFTLHLRKRTGNASAALQYRVGKNIVSSTLTDSGESLCTRLFAEMKDSRTWIGQPASILTAEERARLEAIPGAIVNGVLQVNYLVSPYASVWTSDSVPFYDDVLSEQDVTDPLKLLEAARKRLAERDVPALEVSVSAADLFKLDKTEPAPGLGDTVTLIDPDMELSGITARITELTEYPYARDQHSQVTVANVMRRDYAQIIADLEAGRRAVESVFSGGRIRAEAFEEFARLAVNEVNASKTQVKYDTRGIVLQSTADADDLVLLTSNGIVISTDGGATARTAITANGIAAEQVIGQFGNFVSMLIGSGNNVTQINTNGIAAGHSDFNSAPFRVDMQGNVTANRLTANSANIFSSNFTNGAITGSSINVGNGVFTVDSSGNMRATSGEFSGFISASSITGTNISGGTITGAAIQTATSTRKIVLNADGLRSFDGSGTRRISIDTNDGFGTQELRFYGATGGKSGVVSGSDGRLNVAASSGLLVLAGPTVVLGGEANVEDFPITHTVAVGSGVSAFDFNGVPVANFTALDALAGDVSTLSAALSNKADRSIAATNITFDPSTRNLKMFSATGAQLAIVNIPA